MHTLNFLNGHSGERWWEQNFFCSFTTPQAFSQSSASGALSTLVTSVVLYLLTRATLMSAGNDETRVCGYIYIYLLNIQITNNSLITANSIPGSKIYIHLPSKRYYFPTSRRLNPPTTKWNLHDKKNSKQKKQQQQQKKN